MSDPVKIVIVLEGGCVQTIMTAGVPVSCGTCAASIETRAAPCDECGHMDGDDA